MLPCVKSKFKTDGVVYAERTKTAKINWYRTPIERATLAELNQRSDFWLLLQTLGYLGPLTITGAVAFYAAATLSVWV